MLASHVIRYIKSRRIATRISYDLPVICFQKIYKQLNNVSHISSASIHEQTASVGVQDSDGAGQQCGRSYEGFERHYGKRGNA